MELEELRRECAQLKKDENILKNRLSTQEIQQSQTLADLEAKIESTIQKLQQLRSENSLLEENLKQQTSQADKFADNAAKYKSKYQNKKAENEALRQKLFRINSEVESIQTEMIREKETHYDHVRQLTSKKVQKEEKLKMIGDLKGLISDYKTKVHQPTASMGQLRPQQNLFDSTSKYQGGRLTPTMRTVDLAGYESA